MRGPASLLLLATLAIAAPSCGDDETTGGGGSCGSLAASLCGKLATCFPGALALAYGDTAGCEARYALGCEQQMGAEGSSLDGDFVSDCSSALDSAACDGVYALPFGACLPPGGSFDDGTACALDVQCASLYCKRTDTCGQCAPRIPAGGECGSDPAACEAGTYCGFNSQCLLLGEPGNACDSETPCAPLLQCVEGTCAQGGGAGATCNQESAPCNGAQQLYCREGVCAEFDVAAAGEACGFIDGNVVVCAAGGQCSNQPTGTCAAPGADGAACGGTGGNLCATPATCEDGTCVIVDAGSCQ